MTSDSQRKSSNAKKSGPVLGKDEMNLCELPIAKLSSRDRRDVIEFTGETVRDGKTISQEWIVSGSARFGLPTEFAERVLVALISLAAAKGFPEKTTFTVYEVLKLMELQIGGVYYREVEAALQRLHGVTITGKNTWWDNEKKKYRTVQKGFGLIDNYWLEGMGEDEEGEPESGYVIWNRWLSKSFQDGYIKALDTQFYYTLESTLARRLYRFLDKRMHYRDSYQIDIFALAGRLGMASYRYPSQVKDKLKPAFEELIARNYLVSAEVFKTGKFTRVKFVRTGAYQVQQAGLWDDEPEDEAETAIEGRGEAREAYDGEIPAKVEEGALAALYDVYGTSDALKQTWQNVLGECARSMNSDSYWMVADSVLLDFTEDVAVIAVNPKSKDWVARQMCRTFLRELTMSLGSKVREICFVDLSNTVRNVDSYTML